MNFDRVIEILSIKDLSKLTAERLEKKAETCSKKSQAMDKQLEIAQAMNLISSLINPAVLSELTDPHKTSIIAAYNASTPEVQKKIANLIVAVFKKGLEQSHNWAELTDAYTPVLNLVQGKAVDFDLKLNVIVNFLKFSQDPDKNRKQLESFSQICSQKYSNIQAMQLRKFLRKSSSKELSGFTSGLEENENKTTQPAIITSPISAEPESSFSSFEPKIPAQDEQIAAPIKYILELLNLDSSKEAIQQIRAKLNKSDSALPKNLEQYEEDVKLITLLNYFGTSFCELILVDNDKFCSILEKLLKSDHQKYFLRLLDKPLQQKIISNSKDLAAALPKFQDRSSFLNFLGGDFIIDLFRKNGSFDSSLKQFSEDDRSLILDTIGLDVLIKRGVGIDSIINGYPINKALSVIKRIDSSLMIDQLDNNITFDKLLRIVPMQQRSELLRHFKKNWQQFFIGDEEVFLNVVKLLNVENSTDDDSKDLSDEAVQFIKGMSVELDSPDDFGFFINVLNSKSLFILESQEFLNQFRTKLTTEEDIIALVNSTENGNSNVSQPQVMNRLINIIYSVARSDQNFQGLIAGSNKITAFMKLTTCGTIINDNYIQKFKPGMFHSRYQRATNLVEKLQAERDRIVDPLAIADSQTVTDILNTTIVHVYTHYKSIQDSHSSLSQLLENCLFELLSIDRNSPEVEKALKNRNSVFRRFDCFFCLGREEGNFDQDKQTDPIFTLIRNKIINNQDLTQKVRANAETLKAAESLDDDETSFFHKLYHQIKS